MAVFANNTILTWFLFFLLIIGLHFLIPALAGKIFNPAAELLVLIGIPIKEAKTGTKTYPVTA